MAKTRDPKTGTPEIIILGLGNPGASYARNRHNVGFMVLEALARAASGRWQARGSPAPAGPRSPGGRCCWPSR